jgi:hypothetical protein
MAKRRRRRPARWSSPISATGRVLRRDAVIGRFSLDYNAARLFPPRVDVAAYCGGTKVKELKNLAPGSEREVDLGKLEP